MSVTKRRVLFVSYCFPPMGGVSVQRVTKFVKYLPEYGWDCSVLTVQDPSEALMDESLLKEIPAATIVRRARTYEPSQAVKAAVSAGAPASRSLVASGLNAVKGILRKCATTLLQPDAQILWRPHALTEGSKLLREIPHDAIVATAPPFSSLMLGASLARRTGLPLVLDYRDEWGISNAYWENRQANRLVNSLQLRMQYSAIRAARALVATTPSSSAELGRIAAAARSNAFAMHIYNGFDSDQFETARECSQRNDLGNGISRFRLSFVGSLWNLNPIEPFLEGVRLLETRYPELACQLEVVIAGKKTIAQQQALERFKGNTIAVTPLPFMPHDEALRLMAGSDALLMLNADKPDTGRIINAKSFEYMAARRPILVVAPEGDLWDVVRDLPGTELCHPSDPDRIAKGLKTMISRYLSGHRFHPEEWHIDHFDRRNLAGELATLLDEVSGDRQPSQMADHNGSVLHSYQR